jgi:DNA-binding IclR family transcriptional regulator
MADYGIDVVRRAVRVLGILSESDELALPEVAERLGAGKSTTYRLLTTLCLDDMVVQDPATKHYRLGPRLIGLGTSAAERTDVIEAARPVMERLADAHHVVITLNLPTRDAVLEARRVPRHGRGEFVAIGAPLPYHACASGLLFLAFGSGELRERIASGPLTRHASATPVTAGELEAIVDRVRVDGVVRAVDTLSEGITAVAAPITDAGGTVIATLGATAPSGALGRREWTALASVLAEQGRAVGALIGGGRPPVAVEPR